MIYIKIAIIAVVLYISLKVFRAALSTLLSGEKIKVIYLKIFPTIELLLWSVLFFWALHQLFSEISIYPFLAAIIIIVLVLITGWYLLRDVFAGVILRADKAFRKGQEIKTSSVSGSISRIGWRSLLVLTVEGEEIIMPYAKLINDRISVRSSTGISAGYFVNFRIPVKYSPEFIITFIHKSMIEMPWIISPENIKIRLQKEDDNFLAEIHYSTIGPEMAMKTEETLKRLAEKLP